MRNIDRRGLLGSLAVGTLCGRFSGAKASQAIEPALGKHRSDDHWSWFVARQRREPTGPHLVDFWSMPKCNIGYASQLSPQIVRGALWQDREPHLDYRDHPGLDYVDLILAEERVDWLSSQCLFSKCVADIENVTNSLARIIGESARTGCSGRTALLALGSQCSATPDQGWAEILPAFRRCYDRVIGHFHIERRGFQHWKTWLRETPFDPSFFDQFFTTAALQCDAVILTSQSLAENDDHLPARASTEALVGELMRRLSQVLLDEELLAEIAPLEISPTEKTTHPRIFALGSAGASVNFPSIAPSDLLRQRELVFSSFGKPILRPLLIATCINERGAESIQNQIVGSNIKFLKTKTSGDRKSDGELFEWFEFATLWPFDPDYGPWP